MKYFLEKIIERNGEYEYETVSVFSAESLKEAKEKSEKVCAKWYGKPNSKDEDGYWFDHVLVVGANVAEISKDAYQELLPIL
jgi:hypothetical protein